MTSGSKIYDSFTSCRKNFDKKFAVLIDPDRSKLTNLDRIIGLAQENEVDYLFVGGSLVLENKLKETLQFIKSQCDIPLILFPGDITQINDQADALLLLSLISGRNPEYLIGKHVLAAPSLKRSSLEVIPTGYILVDGGVENTVSYISNTKPIPRLKNEIAVCTATAGELLGLKTIYLDAGSGAKVPVSTDMIKEVRKAVDLPLIVGGGIRTPQKVLANMEAGADVIVVGNAIENSPSFLSEIGNLIHSYSE
jgi:putative glycerol-1-phosphate prenyltransferase